MAAASGLVTFKELGFKAGDALLGESEVGAGAFEPFLELAVLVGELVDAVLEGGVLSPATTRPTLTAPKP